MTGKERVRMKPEESIPQGMRQCNRCFRVLETASAFHLLEPGIYRRACKRCQNAAAYRRQKALAAEGLGSVGELSRGDEATRRKLNAKALALRAALARESLGKVYSWKCCYCERLFTSLIKPVPPVRCPHCGIGNKQEPTVSEIE